MRPRVILVKGTAGSSTFEIREKQILAQYKLSLFFKDIPTILVFSYIRSHTNYLFDKFLACRPQAKSQPFPSMMLDVRSQMTCRL